MDWKAIEQSLVATAITVGTKLLGALVVFIVGRWAISVVVNLVGRVLRGYKLDETIMGVVQNCEVKQPPGSAVSAVPKSPRSGR
jgi:Conserved TM helix